MRGNTSQSILDTVITSHCIQSIHGNVFSSLHYTLYNARQAVSSDIMPCIVVVSVSDVSEGDSAVLRRMIV